jgi:hypothetical protein
MNARGGYAKYEAVVIVVAAAQNMCPDVMPILAAYANVGPAADAYASCVGVVDRR